MRLAHVVAELLTEAGIEANESASAVTCQIGQFRHTVHTHIRCYRTRPFDHIGIPVTKHSEDTTQQLMALLQQKGLVESGDDGKPHWTEAAIQLSVSRG